jgi:hypothetical protein
VGRYPFPRFQVEPSQDARPQRDIRWPILVLGTSSVIVSALLFGIYAIVGAATSGAGCGMGGGAAPCSNAIFQDLFLYPALALLAVGVAAIVVVFFDVFGTART